MTASTQTSEIALTDEERMVMHSAERDGYVSASLFAKGDFSEEGFLLFGRLEGLCRRGLLRFVDRFGDNDRAPGDLRMVFAPMVALTA